MAKHSLNLCRREGGEANSLRSNSLPSFSSLQQMHGWIYGVKDGMLRNLGMAVNSNEELHAQLSDAWLNYGKDGSAPTPTGY